MKYLPYVALILFSLGYLVLAVIGTRTEMVFQWPSYMMIGLAGIATLAILGRRARATPGAVCLISMLLLLGYVLVRALLSPVGYFGRMDAAMALVAMVVYLLFAQCLPRARYRQFFVGVLFLLCVGNLLVGLHHVFRDSSYMILPGYSRPEQVGAGGFYRNHNHLGGFLLVTSGFAAALTFFGKMGPKLRMVTGFVSLISYGGVAMTASRGSLLSLGIATMLFIGLSLYLARRLYQYEFKKILVIAAPLLAILCIGTAFIGLKFVMKRSGKGADVREQVTKLDNDASGRFLMWSLAIDQWREYPVVGQGARMYDVYSVEHWPASRRKEHGDAEFAHNDYLQMLSEYGVIGLGLMLFVIVAHVTSGLRFVLRYRKIEGDAGGGRGRTNGPLGLCIGALMVLAAYGVHSMVDFNLHLPANMVPVCFALAILANPSGRSGERRRAPKWLLGIGRVVMPVAGATLLVAGFFFARGEWHLEKARRVPIANYSEVIAHTDESLKYDQGNYYTHMLRGTALMLMGFDFDIEQLRGGFMARATASFEQALERNPYDIFSLIGLGRCYDALDQHERAEEYFIQATKIGIRSREAHFRYGQHHVEIGLGLVTENLVEAMRRLELGEQEIYRAWHSNELITREDRDYQELEQVRIYLSHVYEIHGDRLVAASVGFREAGDAASEFSYLESGLEYLSKARRGNAERQDILNAKRHDAGARMLELQKIDPSLGN